MANKSNLRIATVLDGLKQHNNAVIDAIDNASKYSDQLTDAQSGDNTANWARTLFSTADTGSVSLTVNATAKTISCLAGAGLFGNFRVGRDVQTIAFSNAANNGANEITAVAADGDSITIGSATGLVDETDTTSRAKESATADEKAVVDSVIADIASHTAVKVTLDSHRNTLTDNIW